MMELQPFYDPRPTDEEMLANIPAHAIVIEWDLETCEDKCGCAVCIADAYLDHDLTPEVDDIIRNNEEGADDVHLS
jgi:hypothetical protein